MNKVNDPLYACPYCGDTMLGVTEKQIQIFGSPTCCDYAMVIMDADKIHLIVRSLVKLINNLEKEILGDMA